MAVSKRTCSARLKYQYSVPSALPGMKSPMLEEQIAVGVSRGASSPMRASKSSCTFSTWGQCEA